jgi:hypothetical protein
MSLTVEWIFLFLCRCTHYTGRHRILFRLSLIKTVTLFHLLLPLRVGCSVTSFLPQMDWHLLHAPRSWSAWRLPLLDAFICLCVYLNSVGAAFPKQSMESLYGVWVVVALGLYQWSTSKNLVVVHCSNANVWFLVKFEEVTVFAHTFFGTSCEI